MMVYFRSALIVEFCGAAKMGAALNLVEMADHTGIQERQRDGM